MLTRPSLLAAALAVALPVTTAGQVAASATDITHQEVMTVLAGMGESIDRQLKVVDIGAGNVAVGILRRDSDNDTDGEHRGLVHIEVSEVYYIVSGGGTLLTGGEHSNESQPTDLGVLVGPSYSATAIGGDVRAVWEGDLVVIPAGTVHAWLHIPDEVVYLSIRPDPHSALPAGYVNPEIGGR